MTASKTDEDSSTSLDLFESVPHYSITDVKASYKISKPLSLSKTGQALHATMFDLDRLIADGILLEPGPWKYTPNQLRIFFRLGEAKDYNSLESLLYDQRFPNLREKEPWCKTSLAEQGIFVSNKFDVHENVWTVVVVGLLVIRVVAAIVKTLGKDAAPFCIWFREEAYNNTPLHEKIFETEILLRVCHTLLHNYQNFVQSAAKEGAFAVIINIVHRLCIEHGVGTSELKATIKKS